MRCPICGSELVEGHGRKFETLSDHVSDPNGRNRPLRPTFECHGTVHLDLKNEDIKCPMSDSGFWDDYGEFYSQVDYKLYKRIKGLCDKEMTEALNSHARKSHTEIYKKDEEFVLFRIFKYKWRVKFNYESDMDGNIIKRRPYIRRLKKDDIGWVYDPPWWKSFLYSVKNFHQLIERYNENPTNKWVEDEVKREFSPLPDWDQRFYRRLYKKYLFLFYNDIRYKIFAKEFLMEGGM